MLLHRLYSIRILAIRRLLLPVIAVAASITLTLNAEPARAAESCTATVTVTKLGSCKDNQTKSMTIASLSRVTDIKLVQNRGNCTCNSSEYYISGDNKVVAKGSCRGDFEVTGTKADCEAAGGAEIAQVPLFLTGNSEPNVMFILDDSGSMQFEIMPDRNVFFGENNGSVMYLFPRASNIYGGSDYSNRVVSVDNVGGNAGYNFINRSPQFNTLYYDPSVSYEPWTKADGSLYPNASPGCALHNPEKSGTGADRCRNLTAYNTNYNNNTWHGCKNTSSGDCSSTSDSKTFWPATYYWYKLDPAVDGADSDAAWNYSNYEEVEIKSGTGTYSGHGRTFRTDCADAANGNCTYSEEIQNFANWYTYYRSRILAARGGIGSAFATQGSGMRVGFGTLNQGSNDVDGVNTTVIDEGVRVFSGTARQSFYNNLYTRNISAVGTPLRYALDKAGQYFKRSDDRGPWGVDPENGDSGPHASCRRSYTVLMTDGYWSGGDSNDADTSDARSDNDSTDGSRMTGSNDLSYTYSASDPFKDGRGNTLADVAMYYWKNDLRTDLDNNVAPLAKNPAFWQHMTTFGVGLGVTGNIDPDTAFAAIASGTAVSWPDPVAGNQNCSGNVCPARIDDLLHAGVNSRGGFFSASNPDEFSSELAAVLQTIAVETQSSASSIATNSTRLDTGTLVFQARFDTRDWSGQLLAFDLNSDGSIKSTVWNTDTAGKIPAHASRNIFTPVGTAGTTTTSAVSFVEANWSSLSSGQQSTLKGGGSEAAGKDVLNWIRGDRSDEGTTLRTRAKILGDIVNSDPYFVGDSENFGYKSLSGTEGTSYSTFLTDTTSGKAGRTAMLYVGGNDGMLHGFNATTGVEVFGFVPLGVYGNLKELTNPDYDHLYYVDGSPNVGDAYLGNSWKTVLVGATGAGGRSVFAIDVTDPGSMGPGDFLWEFSTAADASDKLGIAMSQPVIARLKAGVKWVAIFGNGYNSGDNVKLFIVDLADGSLEKAIDTGVSGTGNGLASVVPVDTNNDRITDYVYAGDLKGNLWKFDLTGTTVASWDVALKSAGDPIPLFKAVDDDGAAQPITARPAVGRHEVSGLMVYFGTGKYFETGDSSVGADPQIQSFYGIRDEGTQVVRSDLLEQTIVFEGVGTIVNDTSTTDTEVRVVSSNGTAPVSKGWYIDLIPPSTAAGLGERSVSRPVLRNGRIIFSTIIPNSDPCGFGGDGWLMDLDAATGGRLNYSAFDINDDTLFSDADYISVDGTNLPVSGIGHEELIKTPGIIGAGEREYKYTSGSSGSIGVTREKGEGGALGRQSWRQLQ